MSKPPTHTQFPAYQIPKLMGPIIHPRISIGEGSYVNGTSILVTHGEHRITIGKDCAIGHWVYMSTQMHLVEDHRKYFSGDIVVEDGVWIGNCAVIYPNVTIGKNSIVGHAVTVVRDVPPDCIIKNTSVTVRKR